uniref:NUDIX hydrolase n=1 Tax=Pithovirus LCPAC404 TaxID=2506597 RepID=A0A481ZCS6_9VIRU|nr:MAG: NUDIX hydrolase [Pithovirus LCPAC404]
MFTAITTSKFYRDLPMRKIIDIPSRKVSTSYGVIMFNKNDNKWLTVKKGRSYGFTILLKGTYRKVDIPTHIKDCTEDELKVIIDILDGKLQFNELYKFYYKLSPSSDNELLLMDHKNFIIEIINSLNGNYKQWTEWELPKGHKERGESGFQAALREFREETNMSECFTVFKDNKIFEEYCGSDGCMYRTIYWVATIDVELCSDISTSHYQDMSTVTKRKETFKDTTLYLREISEARWSTEDDIRTMLRGEKVDSIMKAYDIINTHS